MLKIVTDEKIEVDVNGTVYKVQVPSMKELGTLDKETKKLDPSDIPDYYSSFFESLGLPAVATGKFGLKHWKSLIEEMTGIKKV